jgi:hypothetical protein
VNIYIFVEAGSVPTVHKFSLKDEKTVFSRCFAGIGIDIGGMSESDEKD